MDLPEHVGVEQDRDRVTATTIVEAPAARIFDLLRQPVEHARISGDGSVRDSYDGPERLELGSRFGMRMRIGVPYRVHSEVVSFEADRLIAWRHFAGHTWSWRLDPVDDTRTTVTETFDLSTSPFRAGFRLVGLPGRHRDNVAASVANLKRLAEAAADLS